MKRRRTDPLLLVIALTALVVAAFGTYVKTQIFDPLELHPEADPIACAFLFPETARMMELTLAPVESTQPPETEETTLPTDPTEAVQLLHAPVNPGSKVLPRDQVAEDPNELPTLPKPDGPVYGEDESYFDDVLFIGDSRTVGLRDMARLGQADYFCNVGMTVYTMFREGSTDRNYSYQRLETLLTEKTYGKIYLCLGTSAHINKRQKDYHRDIS